MKFVGRKTKTIFAALDGRTCPKFEIHEFPRSAFEIGARYIGGCCGTEPHYIRLIAQEVRKFTAFKI